jgi:hypothetical protein
VTVGRDDVELDGSELIADAVKLVVTMHVANVETTVLIQRNRVT